ncbi:MAG: TnpV protein [Oscillospiraceae bacterium]|nr:TnpV protein [Oscillospiraceae bacterium]
MANGSTDLLGLTYTQVGDYLLPNIGLSEKEEAQKPLGRWGMMRKDFLKENRRITYNYMLMHEELYPHCREIEEAAESMMETLMKSLTANTPLPDRAAQPMEWAAAMNGLRAQAEETVKTEIINNPKA